MRRRTLFPLALSLALVLGAWLLAGRPSPGEPGAPASGTLTDLDGVGHLRSLDEADKGSVRLILVLSPT